MFSPFYSMLNELYLIATQFFSIDTDKIIYNIFIVYCYDLLIVSVHQVKQINLY